MTATHSRFMPVPADRYQILPARGNYTDLAAEVANLGDGEICYAVDQDQYYQNEGGTLVAVGATKAQGLLAESALQSGDNVSELANDSGYLTSALQPGDNVSELTNDSGYLTSGLQSGDNVSELANDAGYLTSTLQSGDNISELTNDSGYLTSALQSGDNISELINDVGYITAAQVPPSGVTQIVAGDNVSITPTGGTGVVTINASVTVETGSGVLDGGDFDTGVDTADGTAQLDGGLFT